MNTRQQTAATTPGVRHCETLIIGAGFGGIGIAIRLRQAGFKDILLLEKQADVGGVWWANTYPGAACDIPTALYSFSFEGDFDWSRKYPQQPEIQAYLRHCADKYGIAARTQFNTEVTEARWDAGQCRWMVTTAAGARFSATSLCAACGILRRPLIPELPGIDTFVGPLFHTARWDHSVDWRDRRVAVIGTGASAVQVVPELARSARSVRVFQRSSPYCLHRPDRAYGRAERSLRRRVPLLARIDRLRTWCNFELLGLGFMHSPLIMREIQRRCRANLHRGTAGNAALTAQLTPDYDIGCKRILITTEYYQALAQPHVELVSGAVASLHRDAVETVDGTRHDCDMVVLATGFHTLDFVAPMNVIGAGGQTLDKAWASGPAAYKGVTVAGFPNLFLLYGPNTNLGHNSIVYMLESQFNYIVSAIQQMDSAGIAALEVKEDRLKEWSDDVQQSLRNTPWQSGCSSWYLDKEGNNYLNWPHLTQRYRRELRSLDLQDYHCVTN
jgi:cation diffusion facilitator CzcD-associated flavoprotein CzcO